MGSAPAIHRNESCTFADQAGVLYGSIGPRRHCEKIRVVPGAEREFRHRRRCRHSAEGRTRCLNRFYFGLNANGFGLGTHLQAAVQHRRLGYVHLDGRNLHRLEPRNLKPYSVIARRQ